MSIATRLSAMVPAIFVVLILTMLFAGTRFGIVAFFLMAVASNAYAAWLRCPGCRESLFFAAHRRPIVRRCVRCGFDLTKAA
jgi:hypothetical protein